MTPDSSDKRISLSEAVDRVSPGTRLALQGVSAQTTPMAFVRALIRRGVEDLHLIMFVGGIGVDWMARSGCIETFTGCAVTFERYGLAPHFRTAVQQGAIHYDEYTEYTLASRLEAAARNLPHMTTRCARGTGVVENHPETLREVEDPFTGESLIACRALRPEVAVVHAHRADAAGNVQFEPDALWPELQVLPGAAEEVLVTVEEIVPSSTIRENPQMTCLAHYEVDALVEVPGGAHPTGMHPHYPIDEAFFGRYLKSTRDDESAEAFFEEHVLDPDDPSDYLDRVELDVPTPTGGNHRE